MELDEGDSPRDEGTKFVTFDDDGKEIIEESAPLEDSDYEMILENCKEDNQEKQEKEDDIINGIIDAIKGEVLPKKKRQLKDNDLIKLISKNAKSPNLVKILTKKNNPSPAKLSKEDDLINSIQRSIDKKLKKTVNAKVVELIKNNKQINLIDKPKEELYQRIAHKIFEAQEEHQLYFGETTTTVTVKGKQIKTVNSDAKVLILYISNLLLFSKKSDAIKAIDEYGKYFLW